MEIGVLVFTGTVVRCGLSRPALSFVRGWWRTRAPRVSAVRQGPSPAQTLGLVVFVAHLVLPCPGLASAAMAGTLIVSMVIVGTRAIGTVGIVGTCGVHAGNPIPEGRGLVEKSYIRHVVA